MQIIITHFFCSSSSSRSFPFSIAIVLLLLLQAVGSGCQCSLLNCVAHAAGFAPCLPTVVSIFAHHSVNKRSSLSYFAVGSESRRVLGMAWRGRRKGPDLATLGAGIPCFLSQLRSWGPADRFVERRRPNAACLSCLVLESDPRFWNLKVFKFWNLWKKDTSSYMFLFRKSQMQIAWLFSPNYKNSKRSAFCRGQSAYSSDWKLNWTCMLSYSRVLSSLENVPRCLWDAKWLCYPQFLRRVTSMGRDFLEWAPSPEPWCCSDISRFSVCWCSGSNTIVRVLGKLF